MTLSVETIGVFCMWLVVVVRLPQASRDRGQRPLWAAVMLITVVTTLYMEVVQTALADLFGRYATYLGTHLATVVSAAAVLRFVLIANGHRRHRNWPYLAAGLTAGVVVWIYVAVDPRNPRPGHSGLPLGYFFLVSGFSVVALTACALVCLVGARRMDHWAMRWALLALALGWLANALPWLLNLVWLVTHDPRWIAWFSEIDGVAAFGIAIGAALPLIPHIQQRVRHNAAYRRLGPLWRRLTDTAPHVRLARAPMSRVLPAVPATLPLYRRVVEIRDAMVVLRSYVDADDVRAAHAQVERQAVPAELEEAAVTACWLAAALRHHDAGDAPAAQPENIAGVGGDDFDQEVEFLLRVADACGDGLARGYAMIGENS
ncbi:MAB_1171c family putative transporter [Amycolatopsis sp. NPDC059657]|uniref:MAB_1171c family putative transporter n=1 Tax=Amycolatopsis sp. NPDC059657 TaxID=3346899 RepID=UPI003672CC22